MYKCILVVRSELKEGKTCFFHHFFKHEISPRPKGLMLLREISRTKRGKV
jgi:hypothetical protein